MAAVIHGTAHLFGHEGTITNATVTDFSWNEEFANKAETVNESGNVIERRRDDRTQTATITLKIRSGYAIPNIGTTLVYNTDTFEIEKKGKVTKSQDFRLVTLELISSEGISH